MRTLTERQQKFLEFYQNSGDGIEAARLAGYKGNLGQAASRNLRRLADTIRTTEEEPAVPAENAAAESMVPAELAKDDEDEVIRVLMRILHRKETEPVILKVKRRKTYVDEQGKRVVEESTEDTVAQMPPRISDINRAAELLAKYFGLGNEPESHLEEKGVRIIDDIGNTAGGG